MIKYILQDKDDCKPMQFENISDAVEKLGLIKNIYMSVRIVNPINKEIIYTFGKSNITDMHKCYQAWHCNKMCDNCISMRALYQKISIVKIVEDSNKIYTVTAVPILIKDEKFVLELMQNITNTMIIGTDVQQKDTNIIMASISEHVEKLLISDELTGLYNRRFINERLPALLNDSQNTKTPLSIVFADIDFFKKINDRYGHIVGDGIIKKIAEILQNNTRGNNDFVARYGGEEFLICLPAANNKAAKKIAEKIRTLIMRNKFEVESNIISITCSFGVYTAQNNNCELTAQEIIALADNNLYRAKASGRNKVV